MTITGETGRYRGHTAFMDEITAQYGFHDHALPRLYQTLKDALDPDGMPSPAFPRARPPATSCG